MSFDAVVLSSDLNPKYIEFWPLVGQAWFRLTGAQVHLAVVAEPSQVNVELYDFAHLHILKPVPGIPIANQAKVARYYVAAQLPDLFVVTTNDIDLLPLNISHINKLTMGRQVNTLLTVGAECYTGPEAGKFMAGYLTGEARIFAKLFALGTRTWPEFVQGFVGLSHFDKKEDISNPISNEHPDCFSDESLLRLMLHDNPVPVTHRLAYHYPKRMLCRANWPAVVNPLDYEDVHLPRPFSEHLAEILPLKKHLGIQILGMQ